MIKYENLKSENVENAEEVIRAFSQLLYGNDFGSNGIDMLLKRALDEGQVEKKDTKYVFYIWLTIDGFDHKYYKACGNDLTTKKSSAWIYSKSDLELYKAYSEKYELEELEEGEYEDD